MRLFEFEWDDQKNRGNIRKHAVPFEEACSVFSDEHALLISDPDHSVDEERFVLLGLSANMRKLVVCHCYRQKDEVIRITFARKANRSEKLQYLERVPK